MAKKEEEKAGLLSPQGYDDDAASVGSGHEHESNDENSVDDRTSGERTLYDGEVFEDDYDEEELVADAAGPGVGLKRLFIGKKRGNEQSEVEKKMTIKQRRASRRHRERLKRGEIESELVYDMEEGGQHSQSPSPSRHSSDADLRKSSMLQGMKIQSHKKNIVKRFGIHVAIIAFFFLLLYGAYRATKESRSAQAKLALALSLSNGTAMFAPTTILISLDGFRADFLQRGLTPTLNSFIQEGVSPLYMMPSFPSVTFPNHYTMVTGLYPESHGIVGNTFYDPEMKDEFYYTHPQKSMQPKWWGGEPIWMTAETQSVRTAIHMWPGSEAHIGGVEPAHMDKYNGHEPLDSKVERILGLLDLPGPDSPSATASDPRPQLIAAYVPNVDADGHMYGPNSTEIRQTIINVDVMLEGIFQGLQERNLTDIVNVVVVSDHGMATTSIDRLIQLEDLIDIDKISHTDGWPLYGLRPKDPNDLDLLYNQVVKNTADNPNVDVYLRDKGMPERYHFSKNDRIAPLWIVPKTGWAIAPKSEFDVEKGKKEGLVYRPRGLHGYDYENSLMRAIFVARGPAFPHKPNSRLMPFQNIELYNIVCDSLGIDPKPNNGTLRLPLKPVGLHSDIDAPKVETPVDPPEGNTIKPPVSVISGAFTLTQSLDQVLPTASTSSALVPAHTVVPSAPSDDEKKPDEPKQSVWQWLADEARKAKEAIAGLFDKGSKGAV
ncbi:nucleotide pyrophosphatase family protein [Tothia fuscella]|uniref:Nucleotide pyrophosphatase family protein n=1 Tax=Tothia fuscella TaxID=1048955 RepID=A0A9P4P3Z5_9PEZI|nr:nucleotide pyrophosphatase family protein [Tothia fuscella]